METIELSKFAIALVSAVFGVIAVFSYYSLKSRRTVSSAKSMASVVWLIILGLGICSTLVLTFLERLVQ